jgi:MtN3 and saliva related transmembrane protein
MINAIGWLSALILLATLMSQVRNQWRERSTKGISRWLFVGQLSASIGFIVYSVLTDNVVFIVTNSLIALVAITGEFIYLRNRRGKAPGTA